LLRMLECISSPVKLSSMLVAISLSRVENLNSLYKCLESVIIII
jgi:hypothetical protein